MGCSQQAYQGDPRDITGINRAFIPFVQQFEAILGRSIGDIPIQFEDENGYAVGQCIMWDYKWREIKIDPTYWNHDALDDSARMALIFHELGHCVLNRDHVSTGWSFYDGVTIWSVPTSLMSPYAFFSNYPPYPSLKSYYIEELFHPVSGFAMFKGVANSKAEDFINISTEPKHGN
jgi:hypothetical protein